MKKFNFLVLLLSIALIAFSQDKLITNINQTIECEIISISNDEIILEMELKSHIIRTYQKQDNTIKIILGRRSKPEISSDLTDINKQKIEFPSVAPINSQTLEKLIFSIGLGAGMPFSTYKSTDWEMKYESKEAGFAKLGLNVQTMLGYRIYKNLYIIGLYSYNKNQMDDKAIEDHFINDEHYSKCESKTGNNIVKNYLMGALISIPSLQQNGLSFNFKGLIGLSFPEFPSEEELTINDQSYYFHRVYRGFESNKSTCFMFGIGIKKSINENISFIGNVDIFYTLGDYDSNVYSDWTETETKTYTDYYGSYTQTTTYSNSGDVNFKNSPKRPIELININIGFSYSFY
jgi:hypothetical protein